MAFRAEIDDTELRRVIADLEGAPARIQFNAGQAVARGARIVDREMRRDAKGHQGNLWGKPGTSFPTPLDEHVSHEMVGPLEAEIGIEYKDAGKLAHIIVFGSVNSPPTYDHTAAGRRAAPQIQRMIAEAAEDSVFGGAE